MRPKVFTYENADNQTVWYRGYAQKIVGRTIEEIPCTEVRKNKMKAMDDAKKLIAKLKKKV